MVFIMCSLTLFPVWASINLLLNLHAYQTQVLSANTLDLIVSNDPCSIVVTDYLPPFSTSDHSVIQFCTILPNQGIAEINPQPIELTIYDWSAGNYDAINDALGAADWHSVFGFHFEANSLWQQFKTIVWSIIDQFVPKKFISHNKKYKPRNYPTAIKKTSNSQGSHLAITKIK